MKLVILILIVVIIAFFSLRSLYRFFKGEGGCSCSKGSQNSCAFKDKCNSNKK